MDIIYRASNGKLFDDEDECIDYERNVLTPHTFKMWDENGNPLSNNDNNYGKAFYLNIESEDELSDVLEEFSYYGWTTTGLNGKGLYYYYDDDYCWRNTDDLIKFYNNLVNKIIKITTSLGKE